MKNNIKGITMVSLVITIIVLLILSGVSIGVLNSHNGLVENANKAKEMEEISDEKEIIATAALIALKNNIRGDITQANLTKAINNEANNRQISIEEDTTTKTFTVTFNDTNRSYTVDQEGNVEQINK